MSKMITKVEGPELVIERVFQAPRELVFKAYSSAEHLKKWWGPRGWELTVCNIDFRPGGVWHYCMKCLDENQGDFYGMESWGKGVYHEIVDAEKIVYTDYFSDAEGNVSDLGAPGEVTLNFVDEGGATRLVNRVVYPSAEALKAVLDMGMEQGFAETLDRLAEFLESQQ